MNNQDFKLLLVGENDAELLYSLIIEMATYEEDLHEVETDLEKIRATICNRQDATAYIGYYKGVAACYVIYFNTYSSYLGKHSIYIEDIYISPDFRKLGLGKIIMGFVADIAISEGCSRLDWTCLDWNENAIHFYEHLGAAHLKNRYYFRADGDNLKKIAELG